MDVSIREVRYYTCNVIKNVFLLFMLIENIFNTVMNVKGKTKDNIKARIDIALFGHRKNIE